MGLNLYLDSLHRWSSVAGRSTRSQFWVFSLANVVIFGLLTGLDLWLHWFSAGQGIGVLSGAFWLFMLIPSVSVSIRRLHDSGRNASWIVWNLLPVIGWILLAVLLWMPSQRGENRYGPDPRPRPAALPESEMPADGGPPLAQPRGRLFVCPWCRRSNPAGRESCQWCHKPYRECEPRPA